MLLLIFTNQPAPPSPGYVNAGVVIGDLWPPLNAAGAADAVFWTEEQMYEWFNEAGKRLAGSGGVFVVRDTSLTSALATASYDLPDAHQGTLQADLAGNVLKPATVQELEALDSAWPTTAGVPDAFLEDAEGVKTITLYAQPNAGNAGRTIGLVMRANPDDVSVSDGFLAAPPFLAEFFTFSILAEARAAETRAQMPEISAWLKAQAGMMVQAIQGYLGGV